MSNHNKEGFTIVEILLTIVIMTIISTIIITSLSKLNTSKALERSASIAVSVLDEARALTLSSKNDSQYGVHLSDSSVTLFKGNAYSSIDVNNISTEIDSRVGIRNISLTGGGSDVVFKRLTGSTNQAGTFELFLKNSTATMRTVNISNTGVIGMTPQ